LIRRNPRASHPWFLSPLQGRPEAVRTTLAQRAINTTLLRRRALPPFGKRHRNASRRGQMGNMILARIHFQFRVDASRRHPCEQIVEHRKPPGE
jgi:hypothetical protein